jgi:hypothetical protein
LDNSYGKYIAKVIASLPYTTEEELLFVVHTINRTISISTASTVISYLKQKFSGDLNNVQISSDDVAKCESMAPVIILLLLKKYLKDCYSLTDRYYHFSKCLLKSFSKCQNYTPSTKPQKGTNKAVDQSNLDINSLSMSFEVVTNDANITTWKMQFDKVSLINLPIANRFYIVTRIVEI